MLGFLYDRILDCAEKDNRQDQRKSIGELLDQRREVPKVELTDVVRDRSNTRGSGSSITSLRDDSIPISSIPASSEKSKPLPGKDGR